MFYTYLKKACKMNRTTPTAVLRDINISTGSLGNWKKGTIPNGDIIIKLSSYLNVSCDFLLKGIDYISTESLSDGEYNIISIYRQLDEMGQKQAQDELRVIWQTHQTEREKKINSPSKTK